MTWSVGTPVKVGVRVFAAVAETRIAARPIGRSLVGSVRKRPLIILCLQEHRVDGIDMAGKSVEADEIERRFPSAIAQLHAMLDGAT